MYSCSSNECVNNYNVNIGSENKSFIPLRLLDCAHSLCELCVLKICQNNESFVNCSICKCKTSITETLIKNVLASCHDILKFKESNAIVQVIQHDTEILPIDLYSISSAIECGYITAKKSALTVDLELETYEEIPNNQSENSLSFLSEEQDLLLISKNVQKNESKNFKKEIEKGLEVFTSLKNKYKFIEKLTEETNYLFKKLKDTAVEEFHRLHSTLQLREKELITELHDQEKNRMDEFQVVKNELINMKTDLKDKMLRFIQLQSNREKLALKMFVKQSKKDLIFIKYNPPNIEHVLDFNVVVANDLKNYGSLTRSGINVVNDIEHISISEYITDDSSSNEEDQEDSIASAEVNKFATPNEIVTVVKINDLFNFFVTKDSDKENFNEFNNTINKTCGSPFSHPPAIDSIQIGQYFFVYSTMIKSWCRASLVYFEEVSSIEINFIVHMFLLDYGVKDKDIHWYNVREMQNDLFDLWIWPAFAYKCALYKIKPLSLEKRSMEYSIKLFRKYALGRKMVMFLKDSIDDMLFVDLIHYDVPDVSYTFYTIIQILVNNLLVTIEESEERCLLERSIVNPIKYPENEALKSIIDESSVLISHIESPDLFYVQFQRTNQSFRTLSKKINTFYDVKHNRKKYIYFNPETTLPCAALYKNGQYYRAKVEKILNFYEVKVFLVDIGIKANIHKTKLQMLKNEFITCLPHQAIACSLIHVEPAIGFKWSQHVTEFFRNSVSKDQGPQILTITDHEHESYFTSSQRKLKVVLKRSDGKNSNIINWELVRNNLAISSGPFSLPDDQDSQTYQSSETHWEPSTSHINYKSNSIENITLCYKFSAFLALKEIFERNQLAKVKNRSSLIKVIPFAIKNPWNFYVQLDKTEIQNHFTRLMKDLNKKYDTLLKMEKNLKEGSFCVFEIENKIARGQVIKFLINQGDESLCLVRAMDYGTKHKVKVKDMRRCSEINDKYGPFAIKVSIANLKPGSTKSWTKETKKVFVSLINHFEKDLYILINEDELNKEPVSVSLYGRETPKPGAFEMKKVDYVNISNYLITDGFATFDQIFPEDEEMNDDNVTQFKENLLKSLNEKYALPLSIQQNGTINYKNEVYPNEKEFIGIPTSIYESCDEFKLSFRYYNKELSKQQLYIIENNIELLRKKRQLMPYRGEFENILACTAFFHFDSTWNRAEILGISQKRDETNYEIKIRFVDYGHISHVISDDLSSDIFGLHIPKLALECKLFNFKPANIDSKAKILDHIQNNVMDKKCKFIWENNPDLPLQATIMVPDNKSPVTYTPLKNILQNLKLLKNEPSDNVIPREIQKVIDFCDCGRFKKYAVQFETNKFYQLVVSFPVVENYVFMQAQEVYRPNDLIDTIINKEHDEFVSALTNIRKNIDSFKRLEYVIENCPCLAQYNDDMWYRGLVMKVFDNETAEIFFIDYGNVNVIRFDKLKEITAQYLKPSAHGFLCVLNNIRPYNNGSWRAGNNMLTNNMFETLSELNPYMIIGNFKSCNSWPFEVDLYLKDENVKNDLVPKKHALYELIDNKLIEVIDHYLV